MCNFIARSDMYNMSNMQWFVLHQNSTSVNELIFQCDSIKYLLVHINVYVYEKHCKNQLNCDVSDDNPKIRKFWNCCLALTQQISSVFSDTQLTTTHRNIIVVSRCHGFANSLILVKCHSPILIFTVFAKSSCEKPRFR